MKQLSKKVILIGNFGVGKTSLTNAFVHKRFSEDYLTTLGVKIDKKTIDIPAEKTVSENTEQEDTQLTLLIWDIAGEVAQEKVNKAYYLGSHGVIYVFDVTRPSTFEKMKEDLAYVATLLPKAQVIIVGNKVDLIDVNTLDVDLKYDYLSSAKTGENVEKMFLELSKKIIQ